MHQLTDHQLCIASILHNSRRGLAQQEIPWSDDSNEPTQQLAVFGILADA